MTKEKRARLRPSYTRYDIRRFIQLHTSGKNEDGSKMTWRDVSDLTGVDIDVLKNIVSQYLRGDRKGTIEDNEKRWLKIKAALDRGVKKVAIAKKLGMTKHALSMEILTRKRKATKK